MTDRIGRVYEHLQYTPWGETWVEQRRGKDLFPKYQFTGKELDPETNLYYFGARYYDPQTSVWVSVDPALEVYLDTDVGQGGVFNTKNLSLYSYASINPLFYVDPDGKSNVKNNQGGGGSPIQIKGAISKVDSKFKRKGSKHKRIAKNPRETPIFKAFEQINEGYAKHQGKKGKRKVLVLGPRESFRKHAQKIKGLAMNVDNKIWKKLSDRQKNQLYRHNIRMALLHGYDIKLSAPKGKAIKGGGFHQELEILKSLNINVGSRQLLIKNPYIKR
ncbi:MAG: RHS repeat domain-containing protein [Candidatus Goldiibacteriota bacterium]